jgi:hypothetical protein
VARLGLKRGDDWTLTASFPDAAGDAVDLSGGSAAMQLRADYDAATVIAEATVSGGGVTIDGPAGTVEFAFDAAATAAITPDVYLADIEVIWGDGTKTSSETFQVVVKPDVTRDV